MKETSETKILTNKEAMAQIISDQWYASLEKRYPKIFKNWKQPI